MPGRIWKEKGDPLALFAFDRGQCHVGGYGSLMVEDNDSDEEKRRRVWKNYSTSILSLGSFDSNRRG